MCNIYVCLPLTSFFIDYSIIIMIIALTGLPIGYSVTVVLTGLHRIQYNSTLTGLPIVKSK